jgi:hypothetical protein
MNARITAALLVSACGVACSTLKAYDGDPLPASDTATVSGDYRIRAGAPVSLLLRRIDGIDLSFDQHAATVLPGRHALLVDCQLEDLGVVSRHSLDVELGAGRRYSLVTDMAPGNRDCINVRAQAR